MHLFFATLPRRHYSRARFTKPRPHRRLFHLRNFFSFQLLENLPGGGGNFNVAQLNPRETFTRKLIPRFVINILPNLTFPSKKNGTTIKEFPYIFLFVCFLFGYHFQDIRFSISRVANFEILALFIFIYRIIYHTVKDWSDVSKWIETLRNSFILSYERNLRWINTVTRFLIYKSNWR